MRQKVHIVSLGSVPENESKFIVSVSKRDYLGTVMRRGWDYSQEGWKLLAVVNTCVFLIVVISSQIYSYVKIDTF